VGYAVSILLPDKKAEEKYINPFDKINLAKIT